MGVASGVDGGSRCLPWRVGGDTGSVRICFLGVCISCVRAVVFSSSISMGSIIGLVLSGVGVLPRVH